MGGVREIRTPDALSAHTRFPGVPLQPLEHLSLICQSVIRSPYSYVFRVYLLSRGAYYPFTSANLKNFGDLAHIRGYHGHYLYIFTS